MSDTEPVPVGTVVDYHGSGPHGRYVVTAHHAPRSQFRGAERTDAELAEAYPDGIAYELWPQGIERRFGNRHLMMYRVRRTSISAAG